MRSTLVLCLAVVLAAAVPLSAQEHTAEESWASAPLVVGKSASKARFLSIVHTAVATSAGLTLMSRGVESDLYGVPGYWLFAYGTLGAPSAGNLYARDHARTKTGFSIRSAGAALVLTSVWRQILFSGEFDMDNPDGGHLRWDALNLAGVGVMAAGAAHSIATAPASVAEYNRRSAARAKPHVSLAPGYAQGTGNMTVNVGVRF